MNNKGFISVTVIYSFFLVFLSLMVLIIANTATNRVLLNKMKDTIKEDIKDINKKNTNNDDYIDEDDIENVESNKTLADYIIEQYNGVQGNNHIYYHDGSLTNGISDDSYRYAGGEYQLSDMAISLGYQTFAIKSYSTESLISRPIADNVTIIYSLKYDTNAKHYTYLSALEQAVTDGYLIKNEIKNYVCIGSESPCSDNNLFRILGVFNGQVKLIKATSDGDRDWGKVKGDRQPNNWSTQTLNEYLNGEYLTNLGDFANNYVSTSTWIVAGNKSDYLLNLPKLSYQNEIISTNPGSRGNGEIEYDAKIGLMYISDYGFAASPDAWGFTLSEYGGNNASGVPISSTNWLYTGSYEWTITRYIEKKGRVYATDLSGIVGVHKVNGSCMHTICFTYLVRPCFYLNQNVMYKMGDGSFSNPFRITL